MQVRGASKKILVIILGLMTVGLGGAAIYVGVNLQNQQAPEDTSAYGFGEDAVTTNFDPVRNAIEKTPCSFYVTDRKLSAYELDLNINTIATDSYGGEYDNLKVCHFQIDNAENKAAYLTLKGYAEDAEIDDSRQQLYNRINSQYFLNTGNLEEGRLLGEVDYFLGKPQYPPQGVNADNSCMLTLYHVQNDFEYAAVRLKGFNCEEDNSTIISFAGMIADRINKLMLPFRIEDIQFDIE